jgi:hypothetical protein
LTLRSLHLVHQAVFIVFSPCSRESIHNHFSLERHLIDRQTFKERRSAALAEWQTLAS